MILLAATLFAGAIVPPRVAAAPEDCRSEIVGSWQAGDGSRIAFERDRVLHLDGFRIDLLADDAIKLAPHAITARGAWRISDEGPDRFRGTDFWPVVVDLDAAEGREALTTVIFVECTPAGPILFDWIGDPDEDERRRFRKTA